MEKAWIVYECGDGVERRSGPYPIGSELDSHVNDIGGYDGVTVIRVEPHSAVVPHQERGPYKT